MFEAFLRNTWYLTTTLTSLSRSLLLPFTKISPHQSCSDLEIRFHLGKNQLVINGLIPEILKMDVY